MFDFREVKSTMKKKQPPVNGWLLFHGNNVIGQCLWTIKSIGKYQVNDLKQRFI